MPCCGSSATASSRWPKSESLRRAGRWMERTMTDRSEPNAVQGSVLIAGVGASHGLGAAIARRFAAGGYPVAIAGRNAENLAVTAADLAAGGAKVAHVVGDVARPAD